MLADYRSNIPQARDAEVLDLLAILATRISESISQEAICFERDKRFMTKSNCPIFTSNSVSLRTVGVLCYWKSSASMSKGPRRVIHSDTCDTLRTLQWLYQLVLCLYRIYRSYDFFWVCVRTSNNGSNELALKRLFVQRWAGSSKWFWSAPVT